MFSFNSKQHFIITGAASGIGEGIALLLNEYGAVVVCVDQTQKGLDAMKAKAKYPENVFLEQKDLAEDIDGLPAYVKSLKEKYGKFSGMAYCAGISKLAPLKRLELEEANNLFNILFFAPLMMLKGITDRRNNIGNGTSCVIMSSIAKNISPRGKTAFSSACSAITTACQCTAKEFAPYGIRINSVSPSDIDTPMTASLPDEIRPQYALGIGKVSDVANFVLFLLSNNSRWITGHDYIIDCASI